MVTVTAQPHGKRGTAYIQLIASRGSFEKFLAEDLCNWGDLRGV